MSDCDAEPPFRFELVDGIALITLDRPNEGNALTPAMITALERTWTRVDNDSEIRVAILTGAGDVHFCTGASVGKLEEGQGTLVNRPHAVANRFTPRQCAVEKPVICAVNGLVNAGGLHFVADSDIVVAGRNAVFMDSHVNVGQVSALESIGIARRSTLGAALTMSLLGRRWRMSAERAYQLGIVDMLEDGPQAARDKALELARIMLENSPQAMVLTKRAIWASTEMPDPAAYHFAWELLKSQWHHPDFTEGPAAFAEKRAPRWNPDPNARRPRG